MRLEGLEIFTSNKSGKISDYCSELTRLIAQEEFIIITIIIIIIIGHNTVKVR
jgi:hypothetical protein